MDVAVVVCGTSDQAPVLPAGWRLLATVAEPVNRIPAARLRAFAAADFEHLFFTDARDFAVDEFTLDSDILIDPFGTHLRPLSPNRQVCNWLAVLAASSEENFDVLLSRDALSRITSYAHEDDSVWEWVCRAALAGESTRWADSQCADDFPQKLPALVPAGPDRECRVIAPLLKSGVEALCPRIASKPDVVAVQAGILQLHDDLTGSHELSQSIEGLGRHHAGDYWHAIMHCREGDFGNAKYWRRQVGRHPLAEELVPLVDEILGKCASAEAAAWRERLRWRTWNPSAFIDLCQTCVRGHDADLTRAAEEIQFVEMQLLLSATFLDVFSG